jgi:hypothetical protein
VNLEIIIYEQLLHFKLLQHWPHGKSHLGDGGAEIQRNPDYSPLQLATLILSSGSTARKVNITQHTIQVAGPI